MPTWPDRRIAALALPLVVISIAVLLRFDAITQSYGPVDRPGWLHATQVGLRPALGALLPAGISWDRVGAYPHRDAPSSAYISDPYTYLIFAREMRSFYGAHHREPVFPFVTRAWLWLLDGQDVAVSFASASFAVLTVFATYWLGLAVWSRWAGFGAALAMAVDYDAISWSVAGWRDDAFAFGVVICALAMVRLLQQPSWRYAVIAGLCGGLTLLVRITAVTFLVPAMAYLALAASGPAKVRLMRTLMATLVMLVVAAPYIVNCWRVFGDPLYAINHLTADQLAMEARQTGTTMAAPAPGESASAVGYVAAKTAQHPYQTLDTVLLGLTSYPFSNKWSGLNRWIPRLGDVLSWASIVGLLILGGSTQGRLLLLVLAASLLPAAVTWRLAGDWRFTSHAYPFFLVGAFVALGKGLELVRSRGGERRPLVRPHFGQVAWWTAAIAGIGAAVWFVIRVLPVLVAGESLRAQEEVTIGTNGRDGLFFREGWSSPEIAGNVTLRSASAPLASIQLPMPAAEYTLMMRLDPYPRPREGEAVRAPAVRIFMNTSPLATLEIGWNPERVGSYTVRVPRTAVQKGVNRVIFMSDPSPDTVTGEPRRSFAVWYVRLRAEDVLK